MIIRKICKFVATGYQIVRQNTPNSISAGAPPQTPLGELTASQTFQVDFRGLLIRGRNREYRKGQKREVEGIRKERRGGDPKSWFTPRCSKS